MALGSLAAATVMTAIPVHHFLGTTVSCYQGAGAYFGQVPAPPVNCATGFGLYYGLLLGGIALAILGALTVNGSIVFPLYLGAIGLSSLIAGLGVSPLSGRDKWVPVGFGVGSIVVGLVLGVVFWLTERS